jgi:anti-sigma factor RsiW
MGMRERDCHQVDGYLGKWLSDDERVQFEAHLPNCLDCRQFVEEAQRLDSLLARANATCVPVPPALISRIEQRLRQARRRRTAAWATGLAAAAALICALSTWLFIQRVPDVAPAQPLKTARLPELPRPSHEPQPSVEVTFEPSSDVIAVPQKSDNPSVTIIWVYPVIKMDQESSPEPSELFPSPERNGI